jgi:predicted dehydrogenase
MAHTFADGQAMVEAARRNNVIFQVGSQQRSQRNFRHAVELVLNGHIGKVKHVEVGLPTGHRQVPDDQDTREGEAPGHLDFDFWCGPSAKKPYMPARVHWNWRWQLEYGGGQLMDWIGHHNDIAHWGLGMDKSGPVEVQAKEFVYPEDRSVWNAAWKYEVWCQYENGVTTSISNINEQGCKWIGEDGWVFVSRGDFRASNPAWLERGYDAGPVKAYNSREHHRNFLDGIVEKKECICPAETGHRSITPGHLGLLSEALGGRVIRWDPKKEVVLDDEEADKLLKKVDYRSPWQLNGKA